MAGELSQHEKQIFQDIIAEDDDYDYGIEQFESAMKNAQNMLNDNGGSDSMMYEDTMAQLNHNWQHFEQPVVVTGKIYANKDSEKLAPQSWGPSHEDEVGTYFVIDDVELISLGVVDIADQEEDDTEYTTPLVKFAYGLNPSDLETDEVLFFAFPEDLLSTKYEYPTLEGIAAKLHHRWPKEMRSVDTFIVPGERDYNKLLERLLEVTRRHKDAIQSHDDLRTWLTHYLYDRIEFDRKSQYNVTYCGPAWYLGDDGEWMPFEFSSPHVESVFPIGLSLSTIEDKIVPSITFLRPAASDDPESYTEQFTVPATSIQDMRSTRPKRTLFQSINDPSDMADSAPVDQNENIEATWHNEGVEVDNTSKTREFDQLVLLENAIRQIRDMVDQARTVRYQSQEEAARESRVLASTISGILSEDRLSTAKHLIKVEGGGIALPRAHIHYEEGLLKIEIAHDGQLQPPDIDQDIMGHFDGVNTAVMQHYDNETDEVFHLVHPQLAILIKDFQTNLAGGSYPLMPVVAHQKALVNLDGSAEVIIPRLQQLRHLQEILAATALQHRGERVTKDINRLKLAFEYEVPEAWTELMHPSRLRRVAKDIVQNPEAHQDTIEALRQLLMDRRVKLTGNIWQDGVEQYDSVGGIVVDVKIGRPNSDSAGPFIVIADVPSLTKEHLATPPTYVDMSTLFMLAF